MSPAAKAHHAAAQARNAIANWRTCPLSELQQAAQVYDDAILLLI